MARKTKTKAKKGGRRKAKATAEETVETRTVGIGDNSGLNLPKPDDYAHHMKTIKGYKDKLETAKSHLRNAKLAANKACAGLAASIDETLAIEREGDPIKLQKRLELLGMGLQQIGSSLQLTLHDTLLGEVNEAAYKRGYADGEAGKTAASRYPEGSDLDLEYSRGWKHGTGKNMGLTPEQVDASEEEQKEAA